MAAAAALSPLRLAALLLLCLGGISPARSQSTELTFATDTVKSFDCVDPNNRESTYRVRRGEITTVCLYVGPGGDWNSDIEYKRFSVNLVADEFSSYEVPGTLNAMLSGSDGTSNDAAHIFAASQSSLSFLRRYYDKTAQRFYPYLTAIIDVEDGVVRGITWDDACIFCPEAECVANTYSFDGSLATAEQTSQPVDGCYIPGQQCRAFALDGNALCNLKLFVVWSGTDVDGNVLLSSSSRFSMFPPNRIQENIMGQYDSMVQNFNDFKNKIPGFGSD